MVIDRGIEFHTDGRYLVPRDDAANVLDMPAVECFRDRYARCGEGGFFLDDATLCPPVRENHEEIE